MLELLLLLAHDFRRNCLAFQSSRVQPSVTTHVSVKVLLTDEGSLQASSSPGILQAFYHALLPLCLHCHSDTNALVVASSL